jgi:thioredoxin-related protein
MKIVTVLLLLTVLVNADYVHWLGNYDKALEQAKKKQKNLMVFLVKNNCNRCNNIIKKQFMNQKYIKNLNEKFVSVIVTYEGKTSYPIEMYYSNTFPTLFFVNTKTESFLTNPLYGDKIDAKTIEKAIK